MSDPRKQHLLLIAITVAALAPFLNKAFHVDDPLFVWMAQQIAQHPLDPYGFSVNWATFAQPAVEQIQNPPLCSYYIAAVGSVFGWSEVALHLAFLPWAVLAVVGTFVLARRFLQSRATGASGEATTNAAFTAALLTLFTPVFLVSATNVMCDVMLLALWVWSIEFWLRGLAPNKWSMSVVSALLIALAAMTKYFGIALVPLLALYTIWRNWRQLPRVILLLVPVAIVVGFEAWSRARYGRGLFSDAAFYARNVSASSTASPYAQFLTGLAFLGGSVFLPVFAVPLGALQGPAHGSARSWTAVGLVGLIAFVACYVWLPINPGWRLGMNEPFVRLEAALFGAIGAIMLAWIIVELLESHSAKRIAIAAWIIGTFGFATFVNWSITARTFLPLVPAVAILFVRRNRSGWFVLPAALVSFVVAFADLEQANSARTAAKRFQRQFRDQHISVWFQSHWGFQYYMQQSGARPFDARNVAISSGDVMVVPANNTAVTAISPGKVFPPAEETFDVLPWISTMGLQTGASFYSSIRGPVPWVVDHVSPEKYYVARFR